MSHTIEHRTISFITDVDNPKRTGEVADQMMDEVEEVLRKYPELMAEVW